MNKIEMVQVAMRTLQDASAEELAAFVARRYGEQIEVKYIPIIRATVLCLEGQKAFRERANPAPPPPAAPPA